MTTTNISEAAKAVVRRNTEEVQGRGNFEVLRNSSPTIFSITRRSRDAPPIKTVRGSSTKFCGRHFPTFTPTSIGSLRETEETCKTITRDAPREFFGVEPQVQFGTVDVVRVRRQDHRPLGRGQSLFAVQQLGALTPKL